ncbi:penicillin-binding protein [Hoeflea olei]|uniref:Penicillin-binding protein n=2 Tax=Hoeflea olei TaxID=1480615 RepID=A0A1C1YXU8_9HYPH|nr:D-alanyl-D-alanine carboxypeptidase family protein [Hoeflea olei]OCW58249.1 penicillin-binding protein [Hoeflea olei]
MRRICVALAALAMAGAPHAFANPSIAVDVASGRVISHEDAFQRWYPASLTKLMTAYLVFTAVRAGQMSLETPVPMSVHAAGEPPSKMYFRPGERFTVDSGLKYLLVKSANDVAMALAEAVSGSEEAFVREMNATALRLGMTSTRFVNPNGLPGSGQYSTVRDMALLAVALRREFPDYARYFGFEGFANGTSTHTNINLLIGRFPGADGMKTGFICASGFNQVSSATRDGRTVVSVVFGAPSQHARAEQSAELLHAALTAPGSGSLTLANLAPYGASRDEVADISGEICTKTAHAERSDKRDAEGNIILTSPYLVTMDREPRLVQAPSIPAAPVAEIALSRIPLPVARPRSRLDGETGTSAASAFIAPPASAAEVKPLRSYIPIPIPRPEI